MIKMLSRKPDSFGRVRVEIDADGKKRVSFAKPLGGLVLNHATGVYDRVLIGEVRRCAVKVNGVERFEEVAQTYLVPTQIYASAPLKRAA